MISPSANRLFRKKPTSSSVEGPPILSMTMPVLARRASVDIALAQADAAPWPDVGRFTAWKPAMRRLEAASMGHGSPHTLATLGTHTPGSAAHIQRRLRIGIAAHDGQQVGHQASTLSGLHLQTAASELLDCVGRNVHRSGDDHAAGSHQRGSLLLHQHALRHRWRIGEVDQAERQDFQPRFHHMLVQRLDHVLRDQRSVMAKGRAAVGVVVRVARTGALHDGQCLVL
mmetsp:Transcript_26117/g.84054  ORF Transcript_26117/g.84054 Transcript_26117/m.84054 type:complete len:228 (+) Transcript_26117:1364-2047(+)